MKLFWMFLCRSPANRLEVGGITAPEFYELFKLKQLGLVGLLAQNATLWRRLLHCATHHCGACVGCATVLKVKGGKKTF